jgi:hypothetical protein
MLAIKWDVQPIQRTHKMTANSQIFSTTVFGTSSGLTAEQQASQDRLTQEKYLESTNTSSMGTTIPRVPSNQKIMKD